MSISDIVTVGDRIRTLERQRIDDKKRSDRLTETISNLLNRVADIESQIIRIENQYEPRLNPRQPGNDPTKVYAS
jgi:hypothetical protein